MGEALVVAEVEVGLGAVVGDVDLAVLVGAHGARVDVDVGVALHHGDLEAVALEQAADGGRGQALAQGRDDAAGHEDVLGGQALLLVLAGAASAEPSARARAPGPRACRRPRPLALAAAPRGCASRGAGRGAARGPRPPRGATGAATAKRSERLAAVDVEADVLAGQAAGDGRRAPPSAELARALEPHEGDRAPREVEGVARGVGHDLHDRRATASRRDRRRGSDSVDMGSAGVARAAAARRRRSPAGSSIGSSPWTFTTISASMPRDHLGQPVGAGGVGGRGHHGLAAEAAHHRRDALVVGGHEHALQPARARRSLVARAGSWAFRGCPREASPEGVWNRSARG